MKKVAFFVMVITVVSKFFGFGREIVLSYLYGASAITDAYLISQTIPMTIFSFISVGVATGFIPMYSRIKQEEGWSSANNFSSSLSNALLLIASIIVVIVLVLTEPVVKLFASGFSGETLVLAVNFTRITVFGVFFTALLNIFTGYLRVHENYLVPSLIGFPMNLIIVGSLCISVYTNVYVVALGSLLATASQIIVLIPFLKKTGFQYKLVLNLKDQHIKKMFFIALPVIIGTSVNEINVLIDRTLASGIAIGGISALNYARRLNGFVQGLFVASITSVMYPMISKMAAENNVTRLKTTLSEAISIISLLVIPTTVGSMVFSEEIVNLLFGRGAFTVEAVKMTSNALFYYSIGMIAFGLKDILARAFYAFQDTKTPMINATIAVVINIILNIILSRFLGIGGLALATSIAAIVSTILMFSTLRKRIGGLGLRKISTSFLKICVASLIMGSIAKFCFNFFKNSISDNLALIIAIGVGASIYAVLIFFMKIPEVDHTILLVKERFLNKRKAQS